MLQIHTFKHIQKHWRWVTCMLSCMLVYTVVMYLKNELNRGDFFMMLRNQPVALSLYKQVEATHLLPENTHNLLLQT